MLGVFRQTGFWYGNEACTHRKRKPAKIRDQPDRPHQYTELVKINDGLLVLAHQHDRRPDRMDHHQHDRDQARRPMKVERNSPGHLHHDPRPDGITHQPGPEEDQMPAFQPPGDPFAPHANRVEQQRQADQDHRHNGLVCHIPSLSNPT